MNYGTLSSFAPLAIGAGVGVGILGGAYAGARADSVLPGNRGIIAAGGAMGAGVATGAVYTLADSQLLRDNGPTRRVLLVGAGLVGAFGVGAGLYGGIAGTVAHGVAELVD